MKNIFITALSLVVFFASCGNSGKNDEAGSRTGVAETEVEGVQASASDLRRADTLQLGGETYVVIIERKTDTTLPTVKDENDTEFYDNSVEVSILSGGEEKVRKTFRKENFKEYLSEADKNMGVLQGMALIADKSTAREIALGAQVGQPGTDDDASAFTLTINTQSGSISIVKEINQDTTRDDMEEQGD